MNYKLENNSEELAKAQVAAGKHPNRRAFLSINSSGAVTYVGTEFGNKTYTQRKRVTAQAR